MQILSKQDMSTPVSRLDPRIRVACLIVFAFIVVVLTKWPSIAVAGGITLGIFLFSRRFDRTTWRRQMAVNVFFLFLLVFVPLSTPGSVLFAFGPLRWSREGAIFALRLGFRANIVMLLTSALISDIDPSVMAHALSRIGLPSKLVQTLFFCVRYLEVLHQEYHRLRNALKLRAFRPRANVHSLRALGYLVGMLFVRSIDRSDRVLQAMKCRAYHGRLYSLCDFRTRIQDAVFVCFVLSATAAVVITEWGAP